MFLGMHVFATLLNGEAFTLADTAFNLGLWACGGAAFGALIWCNSEANYRKLKQRIGV